MTASVSATIQRVKSEIADDVRRGATIELIVPTNTKGELDYAGTCDADKNRTGIASSVEPSTKRQVFEAILGAGIGEQSFAMTPKPVERGMVFTIHGL